jgi:hypothetical protein
MSANLLEIYGSVGGFAKVNAEKANAVSARIAEVVQEGCRLVADGAAFHADLSARSLSAVAKSKSPEELVAAQREWLEGAVQRLADDLKTGIDLTGKLLNEASALKPVVEIAPVVVVPAPAVVVPAPVAVEAAPAPVVIEAVPAPVVVEVAPVVEAVVEAEPVIEAAPVVEAPVEVESAEPVAEIVAEPVIEVEAAVEAAPAVEAPKPVAKGPVRPQRRGKADKSPVVAAE